MGRRNSPPFPGPSGSSGPVSGLSPLCRLSDLILPAVCMVDEFHTHSTDEDTELSKFKFQSSEKMKQKSVCSCICSLAHITYNSTFMRLHTHTHTPMHACTPVHTHTVTCTFLHPHCLELPEDVLAAVLQPERSCQNPSSGALRYCTPPMTTERGCHFPRACHWMQGARGLWHSSPITHR